MVQVKQTWLKAMWVCCVAHQSISLHQIRAILMKLFRSMKIPFSTLIIDEAHLVGDWGSSFRSNFLLLGQLMNRLIEMNPKLRVILQSATITKNEKKELLRLFSGPEVLPDVSVYDVRKIFTSMWYFRNLSSRIQKSPEQSISLIGQRRLRHFTKIHLYCGKSQYQRETLEDPHYWSIHQ